MDKSQTNETLCLWIFGDYGSSQLRTKVNRIFFVNLLFTIPPSCGRMIISYRFQNKRPNNEVMFSVDRFMIFGDISSYLDSNNFTENVLKLVTVKFKFL